MSDLIDRQAAIDIERNQTVDTNPYHFEAHQKFMQFMDDAEISSFGRWQWSNGFNTALTAVGIDLKKLPSAQPEINCSEFPNNSDTISRQAAIDAYGDWYVEEGTEDGFIGTVKQLLEGFPSAQLGTNLVEVGTDCISRQQAIKTVGWYSCHSGDELLFADNALRQLPPIQPKRGRWHYSDGKPARIGLSFGVICDQCGTESEYCTNFCGECGADMRGERNE